mmetsp:Transcript_65085/g.74793  ORF Transcript_65085/g.74793 Transcript_65085/m.74793 type:complete len:373 (-) Transcript_65085:188-1306(-)
MELASHHNPQSSPSSEILCYTFNNDFSCLAMGTRTGFKIFGLDPFQLLYENNEGGIGIIRMLESTNLIALVGSGEHPARSPRRITLWNKTKNVAVFEISFSNKIIGVRINKERLAVFSHNKLYLHNMQNAQRLTAIDTIDNENDSLIAMSGKVDDCYLVYPSSSSAGNLAVFDAFSMNHIEYIPAHDGKLSFVCMNDSGNRLATASDKGTIIRVFSLPKCDKIATFRRGHMYASIYCINFSLDSNYLISSSNTGTIHAYCVRDGEHQTENEESSYLQMGLSKVMEYANYFVAEDKINYARSKISFKNDMIAANHNICAINETNSQIMIFTQNGYFMRYHITLNSGGSEHSLSQIYSIDDFNVISSKNLDDSY